jgi:3,4-dihydroxy 2-butanone 4-phosphate synthase/GTP cyclohydrolase II
VLVILCKQFETDDLIAQLKSFQRIPATAKPKPTTKVGDLRTIGLGSQILSDLGVRRMRILSAPKRIHSISGFGLEVVEYVS